MSYLTVEVDLSKWGIKTKLLSAAEKAEHIIAIQAASDTDPYVPFLTGRLKNSARPENIKGNRIVYQGPYARYLYYGKVMVDSETGKGPMHYIDKEGNEVIRFRKGAKLKATEKNLVLAHKGIDPHAQPHWFEVSKAENLEKWKRVATKAIKNEL